MRPERAGSFSVTCPVIRCQNRMRSLSINTRWMHMRHRTLEGRRGISPSSSVSSGCTSRSKKGTRKSRSSGRIDKSRRSGRTGPGGAAPDIGIHNRNGRAERTGRPGKKCDDPATDGSCLGELGRFAGLGAGNKGWVDRPAAGMKTGFVENITGFLIDKIGI